ncbi:MAG: CpaF family protein [Lachnospiraceae bacterium]|nr:CpaF family protein [Lachnospiraceae bacterium]
MDAVKERIQKRVLDQIDLERDVSDEEVMGLIREEIIREGADMPLSLAERKRLGSSIFNSLRKLDVLQELLEAEEVTEVLINGADAIFVERFGRLERTDRRFSSEEKLYDVIQQIVARNNRIVNETTPIVDTRLEDGSRVNIVLPPASIDHCIVTIRRFPKDPINMRRLLSLGSLSEEMADFLKDLVAAGYNMFVSGGTGSGKTTFLNALTEFVPPGERVITIEDSAELQPIGIENLVRLEARDANLEGKLRISIRDLVKSALRMRPDRIIVGECRGEEALEVLQAANTGHDGSLSTGHANSCRDMISRLETMVLMGMELPIAAIRAQIASGIEIFVHLGRLNDRSRKVLEIAEVTGVTDGEVKLRTLYVYQSKRDANGKEIGIWKKENDILNDRKLIMAGIRKENSPS